MNNLIGTINLKIAKHSEGLRGFFSLSLLLGLKIMETMKYWSWIKHKGLTVLQSLGFAILYPWECIPRGTQRVMKNYIFWSEIGSRLGKPTKNSMSSPLPPPPPPPPLFPGILSSFLQMFKTSPLNSQSPQL